MSLDRPAAARHSSAARPHRPRTGRSSTSPSIRRAGSSRTSPSTGCEPGQSVARAADDRERLVLVLEGHAAVAAGDLDFGVLGSRATVFDGPPAPGVLVAPGRPCDLVGRDRRARRRRLGARRPVRRDPADRRRRRPRRGPRLGPDRAARPPPAAARRRGGPTHRVRGVHARRQLVELPAAQARHRGPAGRAPARGALLLPVRAAAGLRVPAGLHRRTARSTSPLAPGTATSSSSRAATTRSACRRGYDCYYLERHGRPDPRLALHARSRPRVADGLEPGAPMAAQEEAPV